MKPKEPQTADLNTWGEIAAYLKVGVRTAQKWEKQLGLPVRRLTAGPKARVAAYTEDLDRWQAQRFAETQSGVFRRWQARLAAIAVFAVLAGSVAWLVFRQPPPPNSFQMIGRVLTVSDGAGRVLWRHTFPTPILQPAANPPTCTFADLEGTGAIDTVCLYEPVDFATEGMRLYCFDRHGRVRWTFTPGDAVHADGRLYSRPYFIFRFLVLPRDSAGHRRVVVTSCHNWSFPDQVAVLNSEGELLGQYWHHGHLRTLALADLDGDGKPLLVLGGVNDSPGYNQATLVAFDPDHVSGSSMRADGRPDFDGMPPGSEQRVVFFSKTRLSEQAQLEFNQVFDIHATRPGDLTVAVTELSQAWNPTAYVLYDLGRALEPESVTFSSTLKTAYWKEFGHPAGDEFIRQDLKALRSRVVVRNTPLQGAVASALLRTSTARR